MDFIGGACPKCGCNYGYKNPGERCGDRSHMYTPTYSPPDGHPGCDGILVPCGPDEYMDVESGLVKI